MLLLVVALGHGRLVLLSLHELATNTAGVLVTDLVDLDGVISAVEGDDETAVLVIGLSGDQLGVESQDVHVLLEHLLHVKLGHLRLESNNRSHRVLLSSVTVVIGDSLVLHGGSGLSESDGHLLDAKGMLVPGLGVIITVVDKAVSAEDGHGVTAFQVSGLVVVFSSHGHAWAVSENRGLGQLLSLQQHGEGEATGVGGVDFLNFNRVVRHEVVQSVVLVTTIIRSILPQDGEGKNLAVVVQERLQILVGTATLKLHFDVVLEFSQIWGVLLHVDHSTGSSERIIGISFRGAKVKTFVGIEGASKLVAVDNSENTAVDIQIHGDGEILPVIDIVDTGLGNLVTLEEDSLRNTRVLNTVLNDVEGVVIQVVVDDAATHTVVFVGVLNNGLLEVSFEMKHL